MIATIEPSFIKGNIKIPSSKSCTQRACALALLNKGETIIYNPGNSDDEIAAINIIKALGADVYYENEKLVVKSTGKINAAPVINCGESGLSLRMFAAIAALSNVTVVLNGNGSLLNRPMHFIDRVFPSLDVKTHSNNGHVPITMHGPLIPKDISVDAASSSQYLTGLLFAFAYAATEPVCIKVNNLNSKPYIDLSLQMLTYFGYKVHHESYAAFYIHPVDKKETSIIYYTESDWSSASFLLVAAVIAGKITLTGLDINSVQADRAIINVLKSANAFINIEQNAITAGNVNELTAFEFDATDCPDLFPPLTVLANFCKGISSIKGVSRLREKESDRATALVDVFTKMGSRIKIEDDVLIVEGNNSINPAVVSSHQDHRIEMACAIAGLRANGRVTIQHAGAVNKSYPAFYDHLKMLGAAVSLPGE